MKASHPRRSVGAAIAWLTPCSFSVLILVPIAAVLAQSPASVSISDLGQPDSQVLISHNLPPEPLVNRAEPLAIPPVPAPEEPPVKQTVYWPDDLAETAQETTPPKENLLQRTNTLMRRAFSPMVPLTLRPKTTPTVPEANRKEPSRFEPQMDDQPTASIRSRRLPDEGTLSSLERALLSQQRLNMQTATPTVQLSSTDAGGPRTSSAAPTPTPTSALIAQTPIAASPARLIESVPSVAPSAVTKIQVEPQASLPRLTSARPIDGSIAESSARFVRRPDARLIRVQVDSPRSALGSSALPAMPRYLRFDELTGFLAPQSAARNASAKDSVEQPKASSASEQDPLPIPLRGDGLRSIREVRTEVNPPAGEMPDNTAADRFAQLGSVHHPPGTHRDWTMYSYWWEAPAFCHSPLYYEEINLERYGYTNGFLQPAFSAAHFFGVTLSMPYLMTASPPRTCQYTLGHYRPGSYAPAHLYRPPFSVRAGAVQAAAVTGLVFLIP